MRSIFFFFLAISLLVGVSSASSIYLEEDSGEYYLSLISDRPCKIGAFYIQLNYTSGTTIESVEGMDTFGTVVDIDNEFGVTKIGGFAIEEQSASMSIRIARVSFKGENDFEVIVRELYDYDDVKPILVDNYVLDIVPTPTPVALPEYQPDYRYVSPGQGEVTYDQSSLPFPTEPHGDVRKSLDPALLDEEQPAEAAGIVRTADPTPIPASPSDVSHNEMKQPNTPVSQKTPMSIVTPIFSLMIVLFIYYERKSLSITRRR
ncbi:hypothetical protein BN140_3059 [Methanoculleus bourgensis MS2]|jgi:hypothetical protein|uniref:Uncharacterized protein n=1 Tax=Methanoculleus bourgensis (strain ATCC 43281 / DSM 3045 / OCM 15 / MS2) TaxID=1201294 RepID=W6PPQ7_METBM|nr:hypothetical protein [Methanoculleus bourgensis]CDM26168.1 hypothetical protein BN140_3059 [Methanoculleus bourgensis MS2]